MTEIVRPTGAQDPREVLDWGVDWQGRLEPGEGIVTVTWTVEPSGVGLVLTPLALVGSVAYARLEVAAGEQGHDRWREPGVIASLACEVATTDQRELVRTVPVRVLVGARSPDERVVAA